MLFHSSKTLNRQSWSNLKTRAGNWTQVAHMGARDPGICDVMHGLPVCTTKSRSTVESGFKPRHSSVKCIHSKQCWLLWQMAFCVEILLIIVQRQFYFAFLLLFSQVKCSSQQNKIILEFQKEGIWLRVCHYVKCNKPSAEK